MKATLAVLAIALKFLATFHEARSVPVQSHSSCSNHPSAEKSHLDSDGNLSSTSQSRTPDAIHKVDSFKAPQVQTSSSPTVGQTRPHIILREAIVTMSPLSVSSHIRPIERPVAFRDSSTNSGGPPSLHSMSNVMDAFDRRRGKEVLMGQKSSFLREKGVNSKHSPRKDAVKEQRSLPSSNEEKQAEIKRGKRREVELLGHARHRKALQVDQNERTNVDHKTPLFALDLNEAPPKEGTMAPLQLDLSLAPASSLYSSTDLVISTGKANVSPSHSSKSFSPGKEPEQDQTRNFFL